MESNGGEGNKTVDDERASVNGGDLASTARGSELLSILLKRPLAPETPQPKQTLFERSKTPPLLPTVSREEASRPLTPPARLPRNSLGRSLFPGNAPNSPSKRGDVNRRMQRPPGFQTRGYVNGRKSEHEEGDLVKAVEGEEKRYNELGLELKEGVAAEGPQGPVARWRLQRTTTPVDDRAPQNKPKGPDGSKGFAAGRGRLLTTTDGAKGILGEPPKDSSRPGSADVSKGRSDVSEKARTSKQQRDEKDLEVQLKIAQFLVQRELEEERERGVTRVGETRGGEKMVTRLGRQSDEEAPFAPPPSRQGSRKVEGSPSGSVNGEKAPESSLSAEASLTSVDESAEASKSEVSSSEVSRDGVSASESSKADDAKAEIGMILGSKMEGSKSGVNEGGANKPDSKPAVRREPQASGGDLQRLTQFLEGAFGKQAGVDVPRADFVARAADEWLETDLVSARNKVFAVLEKCIGAPGYGDLVDLEKHLKATLNELRRFRAFVASERTDAVGSPKAESDGPQQEKLEGEIGRMKYDLDAAQMEIGRLEAELAFERNGGVEKAAVEAGVAQLERELERVRLELRAWQGEVENLKGALEKSEEMRQAEGFAAKESAEAKEVECAQLHQELGSLRTRVQETEESFQRSFESERRAWDAELERLRAKAAVDEEENERLRSKGAADVEEIERLQSLLAATERRRMQHVDTGGYSQHPDLAGFDSVGRNVGEPQGRFLGGSGQQQVGGGSAADILDQLFFNPGGGGGSGMTWQQQELTRQDSQGAFPSFPQRQQPETPTGSHMTWQQQEMTRQQEPMPRQQEPYRTLSGGHFAGQMRPPVLHETDLAFAHQQRQLVQQQQRIFQGGHFQGPPAPPSAPQFPKYPAPSSGSFWDNPVISAGPSRGPYSHLGHPPQPGPQRTGPGHPYPQAPPQGTWPRELGHASLARTASAVEQEMLGRSRQAQSFGYSSAMPIPVSVLLAAGRASKHDVAHQRPATLEELGLIEDDEVLFKGR